MIDYKGAKVIWDNSYNWERDDHYYAYDQDILQLKYGENCIIDVGNYANDDGVERHFAIMVIDLKNEDAWDNPRVCIPCKDKADMLVELQRAIDIYPGMIK